MATELVEDALGLTAIPDPELALIAIEEVGVVRMGTMGLSTTGGTEVQDNLHVWSHRSDGIGSLHIGNSPAISNSGSSDEVIIKKVRTSLSRLDGVPEPKNVSTCTTTSHLRDRTVSDRLGERHPGLLLGTVILALLRSTTRGLKVDPIAQDPLDRAESHLLGKLDVTLKVVGRGGPTHLLLIDEVGGTQILEVPMSDHTLRVVEGEHPTLSLGGLGSGSSEIRLKNKVSTVPKDEAEVAAKYYRQPQAHCSQMSRRREHTMLSIALNK